jgi:hypothetical protein
MSSSCPGNSCTPTRTSRSAPTRTYSSGPPRRLRASSARSWLRHDSRRHRTVTGRRVVTDVVTSRCERRPRHLVVSGAPLLPSLMPQRSATLVLEVAPWGVSPEPATPRSGPLLRMMRGPRPWGPSSSCRYVLASRSDLACADRVGLDRRRTPAFGVRHDDSRRCPFGR